MFPRPNTLYSQMPLRLTRILRYIHYSLSHLGLCESVGSLSQYFNNKRVLFWQFLSKQWNPRNDLPFYTENNFKIIRFRFITLNIGQTLYCIDFIIASLTGLDAVFWFV